MNPGWAFLLGFLLLAGHGGVFAESMPRESRTVADTPGSARAADGRFISWVEHRIDDEGLSGGVPLRGGDGLAMDDIDRDGFADIASVHEDSNHLRLAFGSDTPTAWTRVTLASGDEVAAIEDVAIGDLDGDGWPDVVAACENAHLIYFQNPGRDIRTTPWARQVIGITRGRGSWLRVFIADLNGDGHMDLVAPNKGAADIIDPATHARARRFTSAFFLDGDPLQPAAWREQHLLEQDVPNTAMPVDIDQDGDLDILAAERLDQRLVLLETVGADADGVTVRPHPVAIVAGNAVEPGWSASSGAIQSAFADLDGDGRVDLVAGFTEHSGGSDDKPPHLGLGWLRQPSSLDLPWTYFRMGDTLPDVVVGIALADIDGDGDLDALTGGYSGLNIFTGAYSGASRQEDDPRVTAAATVGRIAWFENPGDPRAAWPRHDVSRRVRGMYDAFVAVDLDADGDLDFIATRGNSGHLDGVFWIEQVRSPEPRPAFTPARDDDSRALPLPPDNWAELYRRDSTFVAPNKAQ